MLIADLVKKEHDVSYNSSVHPEYSRSDQHYGKNSSEYSTKNELDDLQVVCPPHTTEKKLMAKIDWRVMPALCILYLLAFLDR